MDVIDAALDVKPDSPVARLRRQRPDLVTYSQSSHDAALHPAHPGNLTYAKRAALSCRIAKIAGEAALATHYLTLFQQTGGTPELAAVFDPAWRPAENSRLAAIVRHVDMITRNPEQASKNDIAALRSAGLPDAEIVSLSGLIAFVNYQLRVVAGLRLLKD